MNTRSQFWLWTALLVAIALGFIWQLAPIPDAKERINRLPLSGLGYTGYDLPLDPFEKEFFQNVNIVKRIYQVNGRKFFITVLDGTRNRHAIHDPYYCFVGGGWNILQDHKIPIKNGNASKLLISKQGEQREALFWFSDGTDHYNSPLRYWIQTSLRRLTLGLSGNEPVLILVQPLQGDPVDWNAFQTHFSALYQL
jgi:hypothetical protein